MQGFSAVNMLTAVITITVTNVNTRVYDAAFMYVIISFQYFT